MPAAETAPAAPTPPDRPSPETLHRQALDWLRRRRWDEAAACLRQLLALRPEEAEALNHLGVALSEQGQYAEALDCFDRALRGQPAFPQAHHNRGNALRKLGRHAAAATFQGVVAVQSRSDPAVSPAAQAALLRTLAVSPPRPSPFGFLFAEYA